MNKNKTVPITHTFLISHIEKLKKMSEETYIPVSALIRKALNEFFDRVEKEKSK